MKLSVGMFLVASVAALALLAFARPSALAGPGIAVGVDADPTGNTATSLGTIDSARTVACGELFDVDVYITDVSQLVVWNAAFRYDPFVVRVVARDVKMFLAANPGSSTGNMDLSAGDPAAAGSYDLLARDTSADPSAHESGSGVLARLTLRAVGAGSTNLTLSDILLFTYPGILPSPDSVSAAAITVEGSCSIPVDIDIKPGDARNIIRLASDAVIPVAILSTPDFDARTVDPRTVCFGDAEDPSQRDCLGRHAWRSVRDVDRDGDPDLLLRFETRRTGIDAGDTQACLTGETYAGAAIETCDAVTVIPPPRRHHR